MTLQLYTTLAAKAVAQIAKYGKTVVLTAQPYAPADATKPWKGPSLAGAPITVSPKGLQDQFTVSELKSERVRDTDLKLLVAAQDPALVGVAWDINTTMFADVDARRYGCMVLEVIKPADLAILYTMRLRIE